MTNDRIQVVTNIRQAIVDGDFNRKVEVSDPQISVAESDQLLNDFLINQNSTGTELKRFLARQTLKLITEHENRQTLVSGIEKLTTVDSGAIITSNHFNPTENTAVRFAMHKAGYSKMAVLSQLSNYKMSGILGFLMRYADTLPVSNNLHYLGRTLPQLIQEKLSAGIPILIYPEQEMWWRYRKPRPLMPGAYHYAAKFKVPIISCFTEMKLTDRSAVNGVTPITYHVHVLEPIFPNPNMSEHENSEAMRRQDELQKRAAFETCYHEPLNYQFEPQDIVGWDYGRTTLASDLP